MPATISFMGTEFLVQDEQIVLARPDEKDADLLSALQAGLELVLLENPAKHYHSTPSNHYARALVEMLSGGQVISLERAPERAPDAFNTPDAVA